MFFFFRPTAMPFQEVRAIGTSCRLSPFLRYLLVLPSITCFQVRRLLRDGSRTYPTLSRFFGCTSNDVPSPRRHGHAKIRYPSGDFDFLLQRFVGGVRFFHNLLKSDKPPVSR